MGHVVSMVTDPPSLGAQQQAQNVCDCSNKTLFTKKTLRKIWPTGLNLPILALLVYGEVSIGLSGPIEHGSVRLVFSA